MKKDGFNKYGAWIGFFYPKYLKPSNTEKSLNWRSSCCIHVLYKWLMCCECTRVPVKEFMKAFVCFLRFLFELNKKYWNKCLCGRACSDSEIERKRFGFLGGCMYELFFCYQTAPFDLLVCDFIWHTYICHFKERSTIIEMVSVCL